MTVENLFPSADDSGWPTGDFGDIDEGIASADGLVMETTIDNDVLLLDVDDTVIVDADTVNTVTIKIRAKDAGGAGNNSLLVDLFINDSGLGQAIKQDLSGTYATLTFTNSAWNLDHTANDLNGMQVEVTANQIGMAESATWTIDAVDVDVDYTAAATGRIMSSLANAGGLAGAGGIAGSGGGLAG